MPYSGLHDGFYDDPDLVVAGLDATGLYARMISYVGKHLTDGYVPDLEVTKMALPNKRPTKLLERINAAARDNGNPAPLERQPKGWTLRTYTKHNRTREKVLEERRRHAEAAARSRARAPSRDGSREPPRAPVSDTALASPHHTSDPPGSEPGFARSPSSALGEEPSFEAEPGQKTIAKGLARAAAEAEQNRTSEAAELPQRIDFDDAAALIAQGREDVLDLAGLEEVLDPTKAHLLRTICRTNGDFLRLSASHLARLQDAGGPVLLEALQRVAYDPPAAVASPAAYLDAVVADVRTEMQARNRAVNSALPSPQTASETTQKGA